MITESINRLEHLCRIIPPLLSAIPESEFSHKPAPTKWSKKEILGHLVDSATNNHQRFVRSQFEDVPTIRYDQNNWNQSSHHNEADSSRLILFWTTYNQYIIEIVKHIPEQTLLKQCNTGDADTHSIAWLFTDYVAHQEHHLKQIVQYQ